MLEDCSQRDFKTLLWVHKEHFSRNSYMKYVFSFGLHQSPWWGFPGGSVVKNPPANAGDTGSILGVGKIPHAEGQLSLCATTTEPVL